MKISWLKSNSDNSSFKLPKNLGLDVFEVDDLDKTDEKISQLIKSKYNTIIISNELAGFSGDIIKKYSKDDSVNIIISRNPKEY